MPETLTSRRGPGGTPRPLRPPHRPPAPPVFHFFVTVRPTSPPRSPCLPRTWWRRSANPSASRPPGTIFLREQIYCCPRPPRTPHGLAAAFRRSPAGRRRALTATSCGLCAKRQSTHAHFVPGQGSRGRSSGAGAPGAGPAFWGFFFFFFFSVLEACACLFFS